MFNKLIKQRDQFHAERDNCLKDIDQLRERNRELERKARAFDEVVKAFKDSDLYTNNDVLEVIQEQLDELERADDER